MTHKFTTPCFIRKNTVELRKKLEELGYKLNNGKAWGRYLVTFRIKECKYITVHPTLALYEEVRKMYYKRNSRKENTLWHHLKMLSV